MAKNRVTTKVGLPTLNTWVEVTAAGSNGVVRTVQNTKAAATIEVALSDAAPAGAGTVLEVGVASEYIIPVGSDNALWVRPTNAAAVGGAVEVDPLVNGVVLIGS